MALSCGVCGNEISEQRIAIHIQIHGKEPATCVKCCKVNKKRGLQIYGHKTAGETIIIPDNPEAWRQAQRAYNRAR